MLPPCLYFKMILRENSNITFYFIFINLHLAVAGFSRDFSLNYLNYFVFVNRALYLSITRNLIFPMCTFVFPTILISCLYLS